MGLVVVVAAADHEAANSRPGSGRRVERIQGGRYCHHAAHGPQVSAASAL